MKNLILIGYWHSEYEPDWPDPARFVDPAWKPEIRDAVIKYLDSGVTLHTAMGMSWCRFRCRQFGRFGLGASELTDGVYRWPDGLSHYLKAHAVRLPDKFVQHALRRSNQLSLLEAPLQSLAEETELDDARDWWRTQTGATEGKSFLCPTPNGDVVAVLPPMEPDDAILSFLHRYRFVPYWRISTAEFLAEVRMGAEYTSKERMDHWRFQELSVKASEVGLALKFIVEQDKS